jgi:hypothetical protein
MIFKQFSSQELPNSSSHRETSYNSGEETAQDQPGVENLNVSTPIGHNFDVIRPQLIY